VIVVVGDTVIERSRSGKFTEPRSAPISPFEIDPESRRARAHATEDAAEVRAAVQLDGLGGGSGRGGRAAEWDREDRSENECAEQTSHV
jgi:hypothetical protein